MPLKSTFIFHPSFPFPSQITPASSVRIIPPSPSMPSLRNFKRIICKTPLLMQDDVIMIPKQSFVAPKGSYQPLFSVSPNFITFSQEPALLWHWTMLPLLTCSQVKSRTLNYPVGLYFLLTTISRFIISQVLCMLIQMAFIVLSSYPHPITLAIISCRPPYPLSHLPVGVLLLFILYVISLS